MQKNFNIVSILLLFMPLLCLFCFDNIMFVWCLMELQMMSYVCSLNLKNNKTNYLLSFIIVQLLSGVALFYLFFLVSSNNAQATLLMNLMFLVLLLKMGVYPFSTWALKFISSLQGVDYLFFLTIMKILPLVMCFFVESALSFILIILNWIYSCMILSYHSGYKKIIFFSSISNTAIFLSLLFMGYSGLAKIFLLFYFIYLSYLLYFLEKMGYDFIFSGKKGDNSVLLFLMIVSLVGIPFMWGFVIKIMFLMSFFFSETLLFYAFLFMVSLIFSFFYMKLIFFFFISNTKWLTHVEFNPLSEKSFVFYFFLIVMPFYALSGFVMGNLFMV